MDGILKFKRTGLRRAEQILSEVLADFEAIHVWVSQVDAELVENGLDRERLWGEAYKRLVKAGLPPPGGQSWQQTPAYPCLGILVHADPAMVTPPFYVFSIEVFFVQQLTLTGSPSATSIRMVWCREAIGDVRAKGPGFDWTNLYSAVGSLIDQFIE